MGIIVNQDGSRTSYSNSNNYTQEKVEMIRNFFNKWGKRVGASSLGDRRNEYLSDLEETYNKIVNTKSKFCLSCGVHKYINVLDSYQEYGEKILRAENKWAEEVDVTEIITDEEVDEFIEEIADDLNNVTPKRRGRPKKQE